MTVIATNPFQHHGGMFDFFMGVVQQDRLEFGVIGVVGALLVPVDCLKLFMSEAIA